MVLILEGDMRDLMDQIDDQSIDCVITDPPYGETHFGWDRWVENWPELVAPKLKPSGSMWTFGSIRMFMSHAREFASWKYAQDVVWGKNEGPGFRNDCFRRIHEHVVQHYRGPWADVYKDVQYTMDGKRKAWSVALRPAAWSCLLYTSPSPRDRTRSRMPSSA